MEEYTIKYSELVSPDDSIKNLITQLEELNKIYGNTLETVKSSAKDIVTYLKQMSAATSEGRAEIDEATIAANRLVRAQKELKFAMSDTGKEVAWLKAQTVSQNKMSVEMQRQAQALIGSYDKLKAELKDQIRLWKALSDTERTSQFGKDVLQDIINTKARISELDSQLKIHVQSLTEVQKAEQRLEYLRSEEGQRLIELKKQIRELTATHKEQKPVLDEVAMAAEKYRKASSETNIQVQELNQKTQEANRIAKLTARVNNSAVGSYNQLAAQYELNKIKLNAMSHEERYATDAGKDLEAQTLNLYKQMVRMQEATGNHRLSVGNYKLAWNGLSNAMNQVIRELPAATMGINTFFLGISNNIPVLIDEISKVREQNKLLAAEGKKTTSVIKTIANSIFSWQTALVLCLTALSMHGKEIIEWTKKIISANKWVKTTNELLDKLNDELAKNNDNYGKNRAALASLSAEWKKLTSDKDKLQFIKDSKSEFDKLDVSVRNVADAENLLVKNTDVFIKAMKLRAQAAAAAKLAADSYTEALKEERKSDLMKKEGPGYLESAASYYLRYGKNIPSFTPNVMFLKGFLGMNPVGMYEREDILETVYNKRIELSENAKESYEKEGDAYIELMNKYEREAKDILTGAGISEAHKYDKDKNGRTKEGRDLTDRIWKNDLTIRKKYEMSITQMQRDEFAKRRLEAIDQTNATIREMQEKFRQNQAFLENKDGKYKPLTPEQKKQIEEQQKEIEAIIANTERKLQIDLQNIEYEYQLQRLKTLRETLDWRVDIIANSIEEEKKLRLEQLEEEQALYGIKATTVNGEVVVTGTLTPEQIAEFNRKKQEIIAEYTKIEVELYKQRIEDELELVKKGTDEELRLLLERNEAERKLALAENMFKPAAERRSEPDINEAYDLRGSRIRGSFDISRLDDAQNLADAEFNIVKRNEYQITKFKLKQEKDRWRKQIELAKQGALDWSEEQIKAAEAQVKRLDRELKELETGLIADKGFGGALLSKLGFDDDMIDALSDATNIIIDNIRMIIDAEIEAAEKAVELAEKRVSAAQSAYDAEVEARNNGYANNVATAKKELQLEKKNQIERQKILEAAQRKQEAIDTAMQVSSLVTATANLWKSYSSMGPFSVAAAIAATAAMWGSFAYAKIKARQITAASEQEYGEGGLEILEGGSHASGNDIDLHTTNSKGKNMRAEGGEALAIINKRNTRKYRRVLPSIIESLNKGNFEDKYMKAFKTGDRLATQITITKEAADLSRLEQDVHDLKKNSETKYFAGPNGTVIYTRKNITSIIKQ